MVYFYLDKISIDSCHNRGHDGDGEQKIIFIFKTEESPP